MTCTIVRSVGGGAALDVARPMPTLRTPAVRSRARSRRMDLAVRRGRIARKRSRRYDPAVPVNMLALVLFVAGSPPMGGSLPLTPVADVPLPGRASRFDYQAVDATSRRLYAAHLGDSS